jgi:hypothetical protein
MSLPSLAITDTPAAAPTRQSGKPCRRWTGWAASPLPVCDEDQQWVGSITMRTLRLYAAVFRQTSERYSSLGRRRTRQFPVHLPAREDVVISGAAWSGWFLLKESRELVSPAGFDPTSPLPCGAAGNLHQQFRHVLSRDTLMREVRGRTTDQFDRYIDVLVGTLRKKFGERAANAKVILTVQNEGYLFTLEDPIGNRALIESQSRVNPANVIEAGGFQFYDSRPEPCFESCEPRLILSSATKIELANTPASEAICHAGDEKLRCPQGHAIRRCTGAVVIRATFRQEHQKRRKRILPGPCRPETAFLHAFL